MDAERQHLLPRWSLGAGSDRVLGYSYIFRSSKVARLADLTG